MGISELDFDTEKYGYECDFYNDRHCDHKVYLVAANTLSAGVEAKFSFGGGEETKVSFGAHAGMEDGRGNYGAVAIRRDSEGRQVESLSVGHKDGSSDIRFHVTADERGRVDGAASCNVYKEFDYDIGRGSEGPACNSQPEGKYEPDRHAGFDYSR